SPARSGRQTRSWGPVQASAEEGRWQTASRLTPEISPKGLDCLRRRGGRIGNRQCLGRQPAGESDLPQCPGDRTIVQMPAAGGLAIRVDKVQMTYPLSGSAERIGHTGFLDVHMEQIGQQTHIRQRLD